MSAPFLTIRNNHTASGGDPPIVDNTANYVGYFENRHGEQWTFEYDREAGSATLRGGDIGWNNPVEVRDGTAVGIILQNDEAAWLRACWNASVARDEGK